MKHIPPTLDMTPDGAFRTPPRPTRPGAGLPFSAKLLASAVLLAVLAGALSVAALAAWFLSMLLPVVIIAAGVAWATLKYRRWVQGGPGRRLRR